MVQETKPSSKWVTINNKSLILLILQSYADRDKKKILDAAEHPKFILDIIDTCKLPQTSTYRKINLLVRNGLLIPYDQISIPYRKNVTKYVSLFKNLEINIVKNDVLVRAKIHKDSRNAILRIMREKIINSRKFDSRTDKDIAKTITQSLEKGSSRSVVPYLLKERIIKV